MISIEYYLQAFEIREVGGLGTTENKRGEALY